MKILDISYGTGGLVILAKQELGLQGAAVDVNPSSDMVSLTRWRSEKIRWR